MSSPQGPAITLKVDGMTCGHCVKTVTAAIQAKDPGAKVVVDLANGTVTTETALPHHIVSMAVEEEGYAVKAIDAGAGAPPSPR